MATLDADDLLAIAGLIQATAVTLAATQPAITWAQQKIVANVAGEGALDITNSNSTGIGQRNVGGTGTLGSGMKNTGQIGQFNIGSNYGQENSSVLGGGSNIAGQYNAGGNIGQKNEGNNTAGVYDVGYVGWVIESGDGNTGDALNVTGQVNITAAIANEGAVQLTNTTSGGNGLRTVGSETGNGAGQRNIGFVGQLNDGSSIGQENDSNLHGSNHFAGQYNIGPVGQYNEGAGGLAGSGTGQYNMGPTYGSSHESTTGGTDIILVNGNLSPTAIVLSGGSGAITHTYTLTNAVGGAPIDDALVWVTTDSAGNNSIASGRTNSSGVVVFYLDAGTYYFWRSKSGYNFTNPDTETVA